MAALHKGLNEAALPCSHTVEMEVLGRFDVVDEAEHAGRVTEATERQQQLLVS